MVDERRPVALERQDRPGVVDRRLDLRAVAHDPGVEHQPVDVVGAEGRHRLRLEPRERRPVPVALPQDRRPREARLGALERQHLEQVPSIARRQPPLLVVVARGRAGRSSRPSRSAAFRRWPSTGILAPVDWRSLTPWLSANHLRRPAPNARVVRTRAELREALAAAPRPVGLVPTMGWLHDGHRALIQRARAENATTVVSIFVNPRQFGDPADLEQYPRNEARDVEICAEEGADLVFAPSVDEVYPPGFDTTVTSARSPSRSRAPPGPATSTGVATVVAILFNLVGAERAYFGQKDAQQLLVIRQMARDLAIPTEVDRPPDRPRARRPGAVIAERPPLARGARRRARHPPRAAGRARALGGRRALRARPSASAMRARPRHRAAREARLRLRRRRRRRSRSSTRSTAPASSRWPSASARPASSTTNRSRDGAPGAPHSQER